MNENTEIYSNPLVKRYSSNEILYIFSDKNKYITWRKLWLALAKAEQKMGLHITDDQIKELEENTKNIDFQVVSKYEEILQHEVMAHIKAYADICPKAASIIHLGETSAFVIDNADIILYKQALLSIKNILSLAIKELCIFADKYKSLATLSFTHLQPAQPTTVGKRAILWANSLLLDLKNLTNIINDLKLRGVKGTTGTAASFAQLLNNNYTSLKELDSLVANFMGFNASYIVTSQTYDRKIDCTISNILSQIAISCHKISNDLRLLQHMKEIEEPFKEKQIGSSAMPYKKNPMLSERISALSKFTISLNSSTALVASTQWLERTLDDSANKRLVLPQMFLSVDASVNILIKIIKNLKVNKKVISKNLNQELPFMITENILMEYVKKGGNRQYGHEIIRNISLKVRKKVIEEGLENNLVNEVIQNEQLNIKKEDLDIILNQKNITGFSEEQVNDFIQQTEIQNIIKNKI